MFISCFPLQQGQKEIDYAGLAQLAQMPSQAHDFVGNWRADQLVFSET
jgi:hypothetical protein